MALNRHDYSRALEKRLGSLPVITSWFESEDTGIIALKSYVAYYHAKRGCA